MDNQNLNGEIRLTKADAWKIKKIYEKWRNVTDLSRLTLADGKQRALDKQRSMDMVVSVRID